MIRYVFPQQSFCATVERRRRRAAFLLSAVAIIAVCIAPFAPTALAQTPSASEPQTDESSVAPVVVPATIQAFFVTDVYAKDSGYVSQVNNDIGDHVKKGEVLAVIEDPELQAQFDKAQAAVQQAKSALDVAKRQLAGMQADLALQQVTLRRQKELFAGKAATPQTLDEAQAKESVASANVDTGKAKIVLAEADLEAAKAETERLEALLQYDKITAPFEGVVTRRLVNPGDLVQAAVSTRTTPLFTVQELDVVRVFAAVPEASVSQIRPGQAAGVKLYGGVDITIRGTVTRIAKSLDPATRTMQVEIDLPNPDEKLLPGMYAQVTLEAEPPQADLQARRLTVRHGS